jgi:TRAP transporter 4TM/12TM fusion protein
VARARGAIGDLFWIAAMLFVVAVQPLYLLPIEQQLPVTLTLVMVGLFLKRPTIRDESKAGRAAVLAGRAVDLALILAAAVAGTYVAVNYAAIIFRQGAFTPTDNLMALALLALVLEGVRRAVGWPLTIVCLVFVLYALFGRHMPGPLLHRGYSLERIARHLALSYSGIYGIPLAVMVRYVILFIVFGALLQVSGAADFLVRFAQSVAGRFTGGLGKVAVVSSALVGTISGSAAGNVATTGSVTIPAMKRGGYQPHFAGAIESVASTGGQIMPPIMGAAAFLMADYLGIPYLEVALAAIIPAVFYFMSAWFAIDLYARAVGLRGLPREELPPFLGTLRTGWIHLALIGLVYAMLIMGYTATRAAFVGVCAAAALVLLKRVRPRELWDVLRQGAESAGILCAVTAGAGIVVGVVQLTGLGAQLASALVDLSGGHVIVLLTLVMVVSIVLGMGMPTTVVYVLLATLVGPALVAMGLTPLSAHFYFFYFGVLAAITPPVALASYAAASIAGSDFDQTGWTAFRIALPSFLVPFFFALNPALLLEGTAVEVVHNSLTAGVGIWLISVAVMNWMNGRLPLWARAVLFAAALLLIDGGLVTDLVGLAVLAAFMLWRYRLAPAARAAGGAAGAAAGEPAASAVGAAADGAGAGTQPEAVAGTSNAVEGAHGTDG